MNREIKFRVWDIYQKRWCSQLNYISLEISSGRVVESWEDGYNIYPTQDFVVQQFTGLKDNKGVEIYEGDFVKISFDAMFSKVKFSGDTDYKEIMCLPGSYVKRASRIKEVKWAGLRFNNFTTINEIGASFRPNKELEVVGNIFENPELIK